MPVSVEDFKNNSFLWNFSCFAALEESVIFHQCFGASTLSLWRTLW